MNPPFYGGRYWWWPKFDVPYGKPYPKDLIDYIEGALRLQQEVEDRAVELTSGGRE